MTGGSGFFHSSGLARKNELLIVENAEDVMGSKMNELIEKNEYSGSSNKQTQPII